MPSIIVTRGLGSVVKSPGPLMALFFKPISSGPPADFLLDGACHSALHRREPLGVTSRTNPAAQTRGIWLKSAFVAVDNRPAGLFQRPQLTEIELALVQAALSIAKLFFLQVTFSCLSR